MSLVCDGYRAKPKSTNEIASMMWYIIGKSTQIYSMQSSELVPVTGQYGPSDLVYHDRLVSRDEVLDVDECIFTAVDLELLKRLDDELAQVSALPLAVVDAIA
jgi:hypothetical protein